MLSIGVASVEKKPTNFIRQTFVIPSCSTSKMSSTKLEWRCGKCRLLTERKNGDVIDNPIECTDCKVWWHERCSGVITANYEGTAPWHCQKCSKHLRKSSPNKDTPSPQSLHLHLSGTPEASSPPQPSMLRLSETPDDSSHPEPASLSQSVIYSC